jgi:ketosteroid isomerase-like protein
MNTAEPIALVSDWIAATDSHDLDAYLACFTEDAVLDDPSVGRQFHGREGLSEYFRSYFIGYNTRTRLLRTEPRGETLHVEVDFTGDFPGGQTGGVFDLVFDGDRISRAVADLA